MKCQRSKGALCILGKCSTNRAASPANVGCVTIKKINHFENAGLEAAVAFEVSSLLAALRISLNWNL